MVCCCVVGWEDGEEGGGRVAYFEGLEDGEGVGCYGVGGSGGFLEDWDEAFGVDFWGRVGVRSLE